MSATVSSDPVIATDSPTSLHPNVKTLWLVQSVIWWVGCGGALAVLLVVLRIAGVDVPTWLMVGGPLSLAAFALAQIPVGRVQYRRWSYSLDDDALSIAHGVLWRATSDVPYHRIQQVDTSRGPWERRLGLTTVQVRSAAATTDATIPGLTPEIADRLRERLLERAARDDGT
jgi:uncharacterized protein